MTTEQKAARAGESEEERSEPERGERVREAEGETRDDRREPGQRKREHAP
jgi:hypothetical protein